MDIDTKYVDLSDEQLLGNVLSDQFRWKTDPASLILSQSYPKEEMNFSEFIERKLKVTCGSVIRFEARGAQKKCLAAGGQFSKVTKSDVNYELTFNLNDKEKTLRTKMDLLRRGINRKFSQKMEKSISLTDAYQCTCKNEVISIDIDECVQGNKQVERPDNETNNQ
jgi:hypothetical protein